MLSKPINPDNDVLWTYVRNGEHCFLLMRSNFHVEDRHMSDAACTVARAVYIIQGDRVSKRIRADLIFSDKSRINKYGGCSAIHHRYKRLRSISSLQRNGDMKMFAFVFPAYLRYCT